MSDGKEKRRPGKRLQERQRLESQRSEERRKEGQELKSRRELIEATIDSDIAQAFEDQVERGAPRCADWFDWDLDAPFLIPSTAREASLKGCANNQPRRVYWAPISDDAVDEFVCPDMPFLNQLSQLCHTSKIRECTNVNCATLKKQMKGRAPACRWESYRDWAVTMMSCQWAMPLKKGATRSHTHLSTAAYYCYRILAVCKKDGKRVTNELFGERLRARLDDLFGVCEIIYWMQTIQGHLKVAQVPEGKWGPDFVPREIVEPRSDSALETANQIGICRNRLWALTTVSERGEADLPELIDKVRLRDVRHGPYKLADSEEEGHEDCTKKKCFPSALGCERVEQLHKGDPHDHCDQACFPPKILEAKLRESAKFNGVWSFNREKILNPELVEYAAISHLWADGTGQGWVMKGGDKKGKKKTLGYVNSCLWDYFVSIARDELGCDGIWWDIISLPEAEDLNSKFLNMMHTNYSKANCTIVHDQYLVDFEWTDAASACIALVLSPWFSRTWTAAELYMSNRVKVIFKDHRSDKPLIKDLDDEILARNPAKASCAHWIATSIIRRVRKQTRDIKSIEDILAILKPRAITREEDRLTCGGILARISNKDKEAFAKLSEKLQLSAKRSEKLQQSCAIFTVVGRVGRYPLFHPDKPIDSTGPFCWAPTNLFRMPFVMMGKLEGFEVRLEPLDVHADGSVEGEWYCRPLTQEDCDKNLEPYYEADYKLDKIVEGLKNWRTCILLYDGEVSYRALLVAPFAQNREDKGIINCQYIGAVRDYSSSINELKLKDFRLGRNGLRPKVDARRLLT